MSDTLAEIPFTYIADDLANGVAIPFLGAGASLFPASDACPPSAGELALAFARSSRHPDFELASMPSDVTDLVTAERRFKARADCRNLALVASWVELSPQGDRQRLRQELRRFLVRPDQPFRFNQLHALIADVARRTPLAIITTNYDDLMEQALEDRGVEYDLFVVAIEQTPLSPAGSNREHPLQGVTMFRRAGEPDLVPVSAEHELLQFETGARKARLARTALVKLHGNLDRSEIEDDTFVITEDDYVSFLGHMGAQESLIPADLVTHMTRRRLLFLGYALRDWNLRVLMDRLTRLRKMKSYAITRGVSDVERMLWERRLVNVYDADLNEFVTRLQAEFAGMTTSAS